MDPATEHWTMAVFQVSPAFLVAVVVVGFFGFVVSATFGIGGVVLLIPLLSMVLPPAQAVAVSAPVMLVNNLGKTWVYRRHVDKRALFLVSALAVPTAFVAALFTSSVDDRVILLGVACLILLSLVVERARARVTQFSDRALLFWGLVTGVISGLCGAAGPPTAIGLKGYGLTRERFVATVAVFAVLLQLAKVPAYLATDLLPARMWPLCALLGVTAVVAVAVGPRLLRRVPEETFKHVVDGLLVVSAAWLIFEVVRR
ncbi:MAG: sulfite exporter TauE/SafE family protein [Deltaproteobacteria bacterium]|nr:sulfite exporter TauE/SafE family protein [Deltaproteobacteria bacterium]